jgi:hypothetical protein
LSAKNAAPLGARLQAVAEEHRHQVSAAAKTRRANEQRGAEVGGFKLRIEVLGQNNRGLSEGQELCPQSQEAPGLSGHLGELRGGSKVTGGLSARGLANVAAGGWSDDFTFIIGNHRYRCRSSVAQFLSPRVPKRHSIDATITELRLEVEDRDKLFGSVLEAVKGNSIAVDSTHRRTFAGI